MKKNCCLILDNEITASRLIAKYIENDLNILLILVTKNKLLKKYFESIKLKFLYFNKFNENKISNLLKKNKINYITINVNNILTKNFLKKFKGKIFSVHGGLLPRDKGYDVIRWLVLTKLKVFHCTLFYISTDVDSGKIIATKKFKPKFPISYQRLIHELHYKARLPLYDLIPKIIKKNKLIRLKDNNFKPLYPSMHKKIFSIIKNSIISK